MNIDRRTFAALTAAGALCLGAPRVPSSVPVETDERFPISTEDYTKVETEYLAQLVSYVTAELRGTIIIDTDNRFLYLVLGSSQAKRYGIGVGREGFGWSGCRFPADPQNKFQFAQAVEQIRLTSREPFGRCSAIPGPSLPNSPNRDSDLK